MQRYDLINFKDTPEEFQGSLEPYADGDYILYADHQQAVAKARSALTLALEQIGCDNCSGLPNGRDGKCAGCWQATAPIREALAALSPTNSGK